MQQASNIRFDCKGTCNYYRIAVRIRRKCIPAKSEYFFFLLNSLFLLLTQTHIFSFLINQVILIKTAQFNSFFLI